MNIYTMVRMQGEDEFGRPLGKFSRSPGEDSYVGAIDAGM